MSDIKKTGLALLREPFQKNQISKLPKPFSKTSQKGNCKECGGYHGLPALHLDYVGHAALTDRLLDCDPEWNWEPLSLDANGQPIMKDGGMWIKLTVCGVTRLGFGDSQEKTGPNAIKEIIGDALRNAAMRFGAALDLWHKGELHAEEEPEPVNKPDLDNYDYTKSLKVSRTLQDLGNAWAKIPANRKREYSEIKEKMKNKLTKPIGFDPYSNSKDGEHQDEVA